MAYYAALVSLVQLLKDITDHDHPFSNYVLDKQLLHLSLYEKFNLLQELLEDYSSKDLAEESADTLERRIRDVAYKTQDIIEHHISNQIPAKDIKVVPAEIEWPMPDNIPEKEYLLEPENMPEEEYFPDLEKVQEEVDSIVEELLKIKESQTTQEDYLQLSSSISTDNLGGASKVEAQSGRSTTVIFDEDLMTKIKAQLCGEPSTLEVVSIVGMGGLGKTTLARSIFDDKLIDDHFDCRVWITVSQDYHLQNILQAIVHALNTKKDESWEVGKSVIVEHIYKHLFGRRYLIILDDVWDTKVWNDIKKIFPCTSDGSRIMVTTRLSDVALFASNSNFVHQMSFLNEDQSWTLLQQKVFAQRRCPKRLEGIGKSIAKNCRGLPLEIVVIAGVLTTLNKAHHNWENIARNVSLAAIDQNNEHLSKILSLSYNHLPHYLKPCFLYLGGFPEDHEIRISKLIRLWAAEGFLKPIESKSLEEVGKEYFKDLVNRNLVLITQKKFNGEFKSCSIHDLLKDLCLKRAHSEDFLLPLHQIYDFNRKPISGNVPRVYIKMWDDHDPFRPIIDKNKPVNFSHFSHVRSVILFSQTGDRYVSSIVSNCKLLRILDTDNPFPHPYEFDEMFATRIVKLLHLRYLKLMAYSFHVSPSIFKLQNLQTFIIDFGDVSLPVEIWKMPRLKHLIAKYGVKLPQIPYCGIRIIDGVHLSRSLQTLYMVKDFIFTSDTIEMIRNLKKLKVQYLIYNDYAYEYWEEFGLNNLVHLCQLEILEINFYGVDCAKPLVKTVFPSNLIKLSLIGCRLHWKDMSIVGCLPNLQVLKLRMDSFVGEEWEPVEGEFLKLKFLLMEDLCDLKHWRAENIHFPCLKKLYISSCNELEEIPLEIGDIPTLQLIEVKYKNNSALKSSALKIQEEQWDQGNDDLQVRVIYW